MEGLCAAWPAQDHDLGCGGVHAALLTPRAAFRPGPHPPVRLSGQPLPHSKPATVPRSARRLPNSCASRFPQPCRYQRSRSLVLSDLQARAVDHDRSHPPRTGYGPGHFMTLSRDPSSSVSTSRFGIQPISACTSQLSASRFVLLHLPPFVSLLASLRTTPTVSFQAF